MRESLRVCDATEDERYDEDVDGAAAVNAVGVSEKDVPARVAADETGSFDSLVQRLTVQARMLSEARRLTRARLVSAKAQIDDVIAILDIDD